MITIRRYLTSGEAGDGGVGGTNSGGNLSLGGQVTGGRFVPGQPLASIEFPVFNSYDEIPTTGAVRLKGLQEPWSKSLTEDILGTKLSLDMEVVVPSGGQPSMKVNGAPTTRPVVDFMLNVMPQPDYFGFHTVQFRGGPEIRGALAHVEPRISGGVDYTTISMNFAAGLGLATPQNPPQIGEDINDGIPNLSTLPGTRNLTRPVTATFMDRSYTNTIQRLSESNGHYLIQSDFIGGVVGPPIAVRSVRGGYGRLGFSGGSSTISERNFGAEAEHAGLVIVMFDTDHFDNPERFVTAWVLYGGGG